MALWGAVKKVAAHLEEITGRRSILKVIGVDVPHAHVHVIPFDEERFSAKDTLELPAERMQELCDKLAF